MAYLGRNYYFSVLYQGSGNSHNILFNKLDPTAKEEALKTRLDIATQEEKLANTVAIAKKVGTE